MAYLLPDSFLDKLRTIRQDYEKRAEVSLGSSPQPYAVSLFLGAKNVKKRTKQAQLVEKILEALSSSLLTDNHFESENVTEEAVKEHLYALQVLMAVAFYIKSQISHTYTIRSATSAVMVQLIDEALELSRNNPIDQKTHACALLAGKRFISGDNRLNEINKLITQKFNEIEWDNFCTFILDECTNHALKDSHYHPITNYYPITSITKPLLKKSFELSGYTAGYLAGDMVAKSTKFLPAHYALTAAIGSGICMCMGSGGSVGVMLIAPTVANKLFDSFGGISFAWLVGSAMGLVGEGLGWGVGMTLDSSWKVAYHACSLLASACTSHTQLPRLTGFNIINGQRIIDGIEMKLVDLDEKILISSQQDEQVSIANYDKHPMAFAIKNEGLAIKIGEEEELVPWKVMDHADKQKQPYIEAMKKLLAEYEKILAEKASMETPDKDELTGAFSSDTSQTRALEI